MSNARPITVSYVSGGQTFLLTDEQGYLKNLGRASIANMIRDAENGLIVPYATVEALGVSDAVLAVDDREQVGKGADVLRAAQEQKSARLQRIMEDIENSVLEAALHGHDIRPLR